MYVKRLIFHTMAKKNKNKEHENNNEESINKIENIENEETSEESSDESSEEKSEQKVEQEIPIATLKSSFKKALDRNEGRFALYFKGSLICNSLTNPKIDLFDTYFEVNGIRHSYTGIEIKHI